MYFVLISLSKDQHSAYLKSLSHFIQVFQSNPVFKLKTAKAINLLLYRYTIHVCNKKVAHVSIGFQPTNQVLVNIGELYINYRSTKGVKAFYLF